MLHVDMLCDVFETWMLAFGEIVGKC